MFVINDSYGNAYVRENGYIVVRRSGTSATFDSREEADAALNAFKAKRPWLKSPVWVEEL